MEQANTAQIKAAALKFEVLLGRFVGKNFEMDTIYRKYTIKQGYLEAVRDALNAFGT